MHENKKKNVGRPQTEYNKEELEEIINLAKGVLKRSDIYTEDKKPSFLKCISQVSTTSEAEFFTGVTT